METAKTIKITVQTTVNAPIEKVWQYFTTPEHITVWNNASDDWHTPHVENDLRTGGRFLFRMAAKDGSASFDFIGLYDNVENHRLIEYSLGDRRKVSIHFQPSGSSTKLIETFDAETTNSEELQRNGWQSILDNFKKHTETN